MDSFQLPLRKVRGHSETEKPPARKPAQKPKVKKPREKVTLKPRAGKPKPRVEPTPEQVEAKRQKRREYERQRNQAPERKEYLRAAQARLVAHRKSLGLCVDCGAPPIPDTTRCETCTETHRRYRRQAKERASQQREQASGQAKIF